MFAGDGNAPSVSDQSITMPVEEVTKEIDLEDSSVDFEEDLEDLDVNLDEFDDFDESDFDAETIDDDIF